MAEPSQLPADLAGPGVRDDVLELVHLLIEAVDHVEEALGDLVDQVVDEHAHVLVLLAARLLGRSGVERLFARRRLRDRDELIDRHHEVDLLVVQTILVYDLDREQEDAEDVVAVRVDARPRLVVVDVRCEQRRERGRRDPVGHGRSQLLFGRIDEVDPARAVGHVRRLRPAPDGMRPTGSLSARCPDVPLMTRGTALPRAPPCTPSPRR